MRRRGFSLSTLTALLITLLLTLSVFIVYFGVQWNDSRIEQSAIAALPPEAQRARNDMVDSRQPAPEDLAVFMQAVSEIDEQLMMLSDLGVVAFSFIAIVLCSATGFGAARWISAPLVALMRAAERVREGDLSVRVVAERRGSREVETLVETFNALIGDLDRAERRLRFNTMALSHELRTPLTILRGSVQAMAEGVIASDRARIEKLLAPIDGLAYLAEDLHLLSIAEDKRLAIEAVPTDLAELAEDVLDIAGPSLAAQGFAVERALDPAPVNGDPHRIRQIILALIQNARMHAAGGLALRLETGAGPDGMVYLRVLDRGPGFPPDTLDGPVEPFWRGDPSRSRASGGSGLGLSIVLAIAAAHGGKLVRENRRDGGASVSVHLARRA